LIAGVSYQLGRYMWQCRAFLYFGATNMLAMIASKSLKFLFGRYRPVELFQENLYGLSWFATQWEMHSLPSGHAVIIFSAAGALSILYRRFSALFFSVAVLVAASRLVLGMHYLSDVVLGAYIGIVSAVLMRHILYRDRIRTC
jgi:membrane-associated phospholipid phosphatase